MTKKFFIRALIFAAFHQGFLFSHCQMPCGIYHDDMIFDKIDQYIETMYKGITVINDSPFKTSRERNETIRWVVLKDQQSDEIAHIITSYFLQQKIEPNDSELCKKLTSAHKLLFLLVAIKQNTDRKIVIDFANEWNKFKQMFHSEGYECEIEKLKMKRWQEAQKKAQSSHDHDHDHDHNHSHEHDEKANPAG